MNPERFESHYLERMRLGWSVKIRSIHEGFLPGSKFVGSEITWVRFKEVNRFSISVPSRFISPSGHQSCECALKYPVENVARGFSA